MNNSYLKVDEIQVRAKHAPLMYVIYVCTLTPRSSALRMAVRAPCLQHRAFQSGDHSVFSMLKLKQRVINKYMFPLSVGVFATPPQLACGRSPPQRAGRGCAGRSGVVWGWAPAACLRPAHTGRKNSSCQQS